MKDYPEVITPEILRKHEGIKDEEIQRDILDNDAEAAALREMAPLERKLAHLHRIARTEEARMIDLKAGAREGQALERDNLSAYLKRILAARKAGVGLGWI